MRIVFAGTPDFAATALKALLNAGHDVIAVYTQPDRPAGRGRKLMPSPVKQVALDNQLPVFQPVSLKPDAAQQELAALKPDVMIVAAYGLILPQAVLDIPTHGCLNIHASLLPRWRGAAPIQRAIAAGDSETGITIMQMDAGLDTGDMLLKVTTPIHADDTGGSLHDRLADLGGGAIVQALATLAEGGLTGAPQNDAEANYAHKLSKEEGHIDWARNAADIERLIRAFNPWPGTFTDLGEQRLRIHHATAREQGSDQPPGTVLSRERDGAEVACGAGTLTITSVQLPGSKAQSINDLINGGKHVLLPGQELH
ncbi:methionyl-tRNA formyltransferase [Marinobacter daepoensis]|uniref:Methionyl-tRNA formyltransferase n=1 Tax=Marinobacter daepoensis TaxID=262077 RepID=A0ABS3BDL7_9GAMM|nr:methionyl-tRNA formyltransferase [Marinobacter daepoensis]MBN7769914.1 methionyl-tRNA formyltransferase [Marinobacter daepoensis]MBY6080302.1 methionyl-tRNA formyltransferase [Marinobacter daepoensis]